MTSYKDRTYCNFWLLCKKGYKCDRALTKEIRRAATKANLPICQFSLMPDCFCSLWEVENE